MEICVVITFSVVFWIFLFSVTRKGFFDEDPYEKRVDVCSPQMVFFEKCRTKWSVVGCITLA